jgi:hypothetical protein
MPRRNELRVIDPLQEHVVEIRRLYNRVNGDIIEIGRRLTECKKIVGHGGWLPWLEREFGWEERTAHRLVSVYELSRKFDNLSDLSLPISGLYSLAAPSTPEEVQQQVIERAEAGEKFSHVQIKEMIAKAKAASKPRRAKSKTDPAKKSRKQFNQDGLTDVEVSAAARKAEAARIEQQQLDQVCQRADFGADPQSDDDHVDREVEATAEQHTRELLGQRATFIPMLRTLIDLAWHIDPSDMVVAITDETEITDGLAHLAFWCSQVGKELNARMKHSKKKAAEPAPTAPTDDAAPPLLAPTKSRPRPGYTEHPGNSDVE